MPGQVLHVGATVLCSHAGQAQPTTPNPRVTLGGQQLVVLTTPYTVGGCPLPPQAGGPCVSAQWIVGATRVLAGGTPVLLQDSRSVCVPTGTPLTPTAVQVRVKGV
jgi:hypothetical protein